jgi:hypothetical protein
VPHNQMIFSSECLRPELRSPATATATRSGLSRNESRRTVERPLLGATIRAVALVLRQEGGALCAKLEQTHRSRDPEGQIALSGSWERGNRRHGALRPTTTGSWSCWRARAAGAAPAPGTRRSSAHAFAAHPDRAVLVHVADIAVVLTAVEPAVIAAVLVAVAAGASSAMAISTRSLLTEAFAAFLSALGQATRSYPRSRRGSHPSPRPSQDRATHPKLPPATRWRAQGCCQGSLEARRNQQRAAPPTSRAPIA